MPSNGDSNLITFSPIGIRSRLILLVFLSAMPALGLILYSGLEQRSMAAKSAQQEVVGFVRHASLDQERMVSATRHLLVALAQLAPIRERDGTACSEIFENLLNQYPCYTLLAQIGLDGFFLSSAPSFTTPVNVIDRAYFNNILKTHEFVVGEYVVGRVTGKAAIPLAYPVFDSAGKMNSVLLASLDLTWIDQLIAKLPLLTGATLTVFDVHGTILAYAPNPGHFVGRNMPEAEMIRTTLSRGAGVAEIEGLDGVRRLYAFMPLDSQFQFGFISVGIPVATVFAEADRNLARNLAALGLVVILVLFSSWLFGYLFVMRRINVLVRTAQKLAEGDLSVRIGLNRTEGDEIVQLACVFNRMAEAIEMREGELKRYNELLARQAAELARSNTELDQFAYVASHDLKEPLRSAESYLDLLARRYTGKLDSKADEFIAYAVSGIGRMREMIDGFLALSRVSIRSREFVLTEAEATLGVVLSNLQFAIQESGALITYGPLPQVTADPLQFRQLFQNLIGNGIKFQRDEPLRIHVGGERRKSDCLFWVSDNGIGIAPKDAEHIFLLYQRLHERSRYPGTGIGLAICKRIVERHGGRIWVESQPGEGSTFYFTIAATNVERL